MTRIIYRSEYNIGFFGIEQRLHPFDSRKYGRAWTLLRTRLGSKAKKILVRPSRPVSNDDLKLVHSSEYLDRLRDSTCVSKIIEIPALRQLPNWLLNWILLRPMRWATEGTVQAAFQAIQHGLAINLGGGFHHAKPNGGEGFCVYNDIGVAVRKAQIEGYLPETDRVVYIDLDAHQGNGVCQIFQNDSRFFIFDMFNSEIYPSADRTSLARIDCSIPLHSSCTEGEYLSALSNRLPGFLDSVGRSERIGLGIYNAGTDVSKIDALGRLNLSDQAILERDLYVVAQLRQRGIPTVMLTSGGYSPTSYRLIAESVYQLVLKYD